MTLDESDEVIIVGFEIEITIDRIGLEFRHIVENVDMIVIFFRQFQTLFCFEVFYENENIFFRFCDIWTSQLFMADDTDKYIAKTAIFFHTRHILKDV